MPALIGPVIPQLADVSSEAAVFPPGGGSKRPGSEKRSSLTLASVSCDGFAFLGLVLVGIEALLYI